MVLKGKYLNAREFMELINKMNDSRIRWAILRGREALKMASQESQWWIDNSRLRAYMDPYEHNIKLIASILEQMITHVEEIINMDMTVEMWKI